MTGNELIAMLSALTPEQRELNVWTEGCDCDGRAHDVKIESGDIIITRSN